MCQSLRRRISCKAVSICAKWHHLEVCRGIAGTSGLFSWPSQGALHFLLCLMPYRSWPFSKLFPLYQPSTNNKTTADHLFEGTDLANIHKSRPQSQELQDEQPPRQTPKRNPVKLLLKTCLKSQRYRSEPSTSSSSCSSASKASEITFPSSSLCFSF